MDRQGPASGAALADPSAASVNVVASMTCPYRCGWRFSNWLERTAENARERHIVLCPRRPVSPKKGS